MDKEMMYWCDFCLFEVGFNQLVYRLYFMRNWCFVLAVSRKEKQSCEQASNSELMAISVGIYVNFYPYQSVYQSWL